MASAAAMVSQRAHVMLNCFRFEPVNSFRDTNPYNKDTNPEGVINMAQSVNKLMEGEVVARVNQELTLTARHQYYFKSCGIVEFKEALAAFLTRHHCPPSPISPDHLLVVCGLTAAMDMLGHILCDPGDVILTPTPTYGAIFHNFHMRCQATILPIPCTQEDDFMLHDHQLEETIERVHGEGQSVRACILVHPHNPLGGLFSPTQLANLLQICAKYEIHVIIDEIYAFSVFGEDVEFNSVMAMNVPDPQRTHIIWGFSKDFALPGFRLGVVHSVNTAVLQCMTTLSHYHAPSQLLQHAAASLINDLDWCDKFYIPTNKKRLAEAYHKARRFLEAAGIPVRKASAGLFLWLDLRQYLQPCSEQREMDLFHALVAGGVCLYPGQKMFSPSPGWFRLVFALSPDELEPGLSRVVAVLKEWQNKTP